MIDFSNIKAFLFDLNGTMIDDMQYHINTWYEILNALGADISLERMKTECYGKNDELLERIFPKRFSIEEKTKLSYDKEIAYQNAFKPKLNLIDGLAEFLKVVHDNKIKMAIGSAAIMINIDFVLDGTNTRKYFDAIVSAEDVKESKPNPETFIKAAQQLNVLPKDCIVFEDTPTGVKAAAGAEMKAIVITTLHKENEFNQFDNVLMFVKDFSKISELFSQKNIQN